MHRNIGLFLFLIILIFFSYPIGASCIFYESFEGITEELWRGAGTQAKGIAKEGEASLLVIDSQETSYVCATSPFIEVSPNTTYDFTGWARTNDTQGKVGIFIYEKDETKSGSRPVHTLYFDKSADWTQGSIIFTTAPTTHYLELQLYPAAGAGVDKKGRAWFDELKLTIIEEGVGRLKDAFGRAVPVRDVEDIGEVLEPGEFWSRVEVQDVYEGRDPWESPLIRLYFFGKIPLSSVDTSNRYSGLPKFKGKLGEEVDFMRASMIIAEDIKYRPIMKAHGSGGSYSKKYYPRRMGDYVNGGYYPAYMLTGDDRYLARMEELLGFLLYSQYQGDGHNDFIKDHYPDDYQELMESGRARLWHGGWDYLFDWLWPDAYGYTWQLHEPDHHVNSLMAVAMVRGYEVTGKKEYLDSAAMFVYNLIPKYGFHTGIWEGQRYYWTEYNPTGPGNPTMDATDNIQSLVAQAVAMVGYYRKDPALLEYARGLLWYIVREFETDGRWYYDGAENPLNQRKAISHDMAVLDPAMGAMPYLIKGGASNEELEQGLLGAYGWYLENWESLKEERFFRAWKCVAGEAKEGTTVKVISYIQIMSSKVRDFKFYDPIFRRFKEATPVRVSRLVAKDGGWQSDESLEIKVKSSLIGTKPIEVSMDMAQGDIFAIEYEWKVTSTGYLGMPARVETAPLDAVKVMKETGLMTWNLLVDGGNFPDFVARIYFPRD